MLLSTFELLVKKIAPPEIAAAFNRTVVQGYFLTISNVDITRDIAFFLKLTIPSDDLNDLNEIKVDREFVRQNANISPANHSVVYDINGVNNFSQLKGGTGTEVYKEYLTESITLKKGQSLSLQILPNIAQKSINSNSVFTGNQIDFNLNIRSKMEIRGFVEIFQAYPNTVIGFNTLIGYSLPAINLLVTAEIRGTFLDAPLFRQDIDLDFDQINYTLPLASGSSLVNVAAITRTFDPPQGDPYEPFPVLPQ